MLYKPEREWSLTIGPDTVRLFILKARAISAAINEDYRDGAEHEVDLDDQSRESHHHDGLAEEESEDLTERELRELIGDLNVDEAADLIALMWVGRGDYDAGEWTEALAEAKRRTDIRPVRYLMNRPMLGEWLEEGLEMIGA